MENAKHEALRAIEIYLKDKGIRRVEYSTKFLAKGLVNVTIYDKNGVPIVYRIMFFLGDLFVDRIGFGPSNVGSILNILAMKESAWATHSCLDIADPAFFDHLDTVLGL